MSHAATLVLQEQMSARATTATHLRKLTVAELRVLHQHYFFAGGADEMSKAQLIADLSDELGAY